MAGSHHNNSKTRIKKVLADLKDGKVDAVAAVNAFILEPKRYQRANLSRLNDVLEGLLLKE